MMTKTQRRATCPACFAAQAVTAGGALVAHGYTRPQHWHQNVGNCAGVGKPHFGTEAGRDYTASIAANLRTQADNADKTADSVEAGTSPVRKQERIKNTRVYQWVVDENAGSYERSRYASNLRAHATQMRASAAEYDRLVASWTPAEPVTVNVAVKVSLVHWRDQRPRNYGGKACAGSRMAAVKGVMTTDIAHVTCEKCRERHAQWMATK